MLDIEKGKKDDAISRLDELRFEPINIPPEFAKMMGNVTPRTDEIKLKAYKAAVAEIERCLEDPNAVPRRDGEMKIIVDANDKAYRGTCAYFLGRLCELRGKLDDAKWWYQLSMETGEWNHSCRPQAASSLRRLGVEYYK
jgi:hypothetical protein